MGSCTLQLRDLTGLRTIGVMKLRFVPVREWFPPGREAGVNPRYCTLLQQSFVASFLWRGVSLSDHRVLR
uniref:Uncharacterized protein n=1 Tax=Arundo donax TaxID=35708 RepID=A0A0A9BWG2_ARUDO